MTSSRESDLADHHADKEQGGVGRSAASTRWVLASVDGRYRAGSNVVRYMVLRRADAQGGPQGIKSIGEPRERKWRWRWTVKVSRHEGLLFAD